MLIGLLYFVHYYVWLPWLLCLVSLQNVKPMLLKPHRDTYRGISLEYWRAIGTTVEKHDSDGVWWRKEWVSGRWRRAVLVAAGKEVMA